MRVANVLQRMRKLRKCEKVICAFAGPTEDAIAE